MNNVTQLTACIDAMGMGDFAESALQNLCNGEEVGNDGDR